MAVPFRPALAAGLCAALLTAGVAGAATKPKPVCDLLTDPAGDANGTFLTGPVSGMPSEDAVDIVSGDVATKGKVLTTALRVKKLATSSPTSPSGLQWKFFFVVDGTQVYTQAVSAPGGKPTFTVGVIDETTGTSNALGDVTGALDLTRNEVRVSVPFSMLPVRPRTGSRITGLAPNAGRYVGNDSVGSFSDSTDEASSSRGYRVGDPSCVLVGR